jgi:hypothetical protein
MALDAHVGDAVTHVFPDESTLSPSTLPSIVTTVAPMMGGVEGVPFSV